MPSSEVEAVRFLAVLLSLIVGCIPKSSLNGGDDDPDELHDALLLPGLEPKWRFHAAGCGEFGEHDKLISTRAALHSSISSPRN